MKRPPSAHVALALGALLVAWLFTSMLHRAGPTASRSVARSDLPVYLAAAETLAAGEDPFGVQSERGWPYVYPPTFAALLTPLAGLPGRVAAAIWFWVSLAVMAAGMLAFRRAVGSRGPFRWADDGIPLLLVLLPVASCLERGQVGALLLGLCGLGLAAYEARRDVRCGLAVGLAAAIKTTPALLLLAVAGARRGRALAACVLALAGWLLLVPAPFLGLSGAAEASWNQLDRTLLRYAREPGVERLTEESDMEVHVSTNQSLTSQILRRTTGGTRKLLVALLTALLLIPLAVRLSRDPPPAAEAWSLALAATLLLSPVAWHHHHVLLWPALHLLTARRGDPLARWSLVLFFCLSTLHFVGKKGAPGEVGLLGCGTLLVYGTLFLRSKANTPRSTEATSTIVPTVS